MALIAGLSISLAAYGFYRSHEPKEPTEVIRFFYDNRELLEDIREGAWPLEGEWTLTYTGYVVTVYGVGDKTRDWHPGLSENSLLYYARAPQGRLVIENTTASGVRQLVFGFIDRAEQGLEGFVYSENELPKERYTRVEGNWYYFLWEYQSDSDRPTGLGEGDLS
jgi:hypothetical protein